MAAPPGALDPNGPGRPVGVAESTMQKWGYTEGETCAFAVHAQMHTVCEKLRRFVHCWALSVCVFVRLSSCSCQHS